MSNCQPIPYVLAESEICTCICKGNSSPDKVNFLHSQILFLWWNLLAWLTGDLNYCLDEMNWFSSTRRNRNSNCERLLKCNHFPTQMSPSGCSDLFPKWGCKILWAIDCVSGEAKQRLAFIFLLSSYRRYWVEHGKW